MSESLSELAKNYSISDEGRELIRSGRTTLIAGTFGAGKDSAQSHLLSLPEYAGEFRRIITHTTRHPRKNSGVLETDGVEYHFVSKAEMQALLENGEMVEVNPFNDEYYGTSLEEFRTTFATGKIALGDVDVNGVRRFQEIAGDAVTAIFLVPPDVATVKARLQKRYQDAEAMEAVWNGRRPIMIEELESVVDAPYYHFVINDDLRRAVDVINRIAHRQADVFKREDDEAKLIARNLLDELRSEA